MRLSAHIPFGTRTRSAESPRGLGEYPRHGGWDRFEREQIKPVVDAGVTDLVPFLPGGVSPQLKPIGIDYNGTVKISNMLFTQLVDCRATDQSHAEFIAGYLEWCGRHRSAGGRVRPYWGKPTRWDPACFEYFEKMIGDQVEVCDGMEFDAANLNEAEFSPAHLVMGWLMGRGKLPAVEAGPLRVGAPWLNRAEFGVFSNIATFERFLGKADRVQLGGHLATIELFVRGPKGLDSGTVTPQELCDQCVEALTAEQYQGDRFRVCVGVRNLLTAPAGWKQVRDAAAA